MNPTRDQTSAPPTPSAASPPPASRDDAAAQALSDALRSSFFIIKIIMILLVALFLGSGFFTVGPQEKVLLLRFGKPVNEDELLGPGPHFAFPRPIDEVVRIPIGEVQTVASTVGWYATTPAQEAAGAELPPGPSLNPATDGYLLTGDGNIVHARGTLRYRIVEPGIRYKLELAAASNLVQNAVNNALVYAALDSTVEITRDNSPFREKALARLAHLIDEQDLNITVDQLSVEVRPPRQLTKDFDRVLEAEVNRNAARNDARKYEDETLNQARAEAKVRVNAAEADRAILVETVAAEAKRFTDLLPEYRKDPQLFTELHHAEALQRIYTNVAEKMIVQERSDGLPRELRLLLSKEPPKPRPITVPKGHEH